MFLLSDAGSKDASLSQVSSASGESLEQKSSNAVFSNDPFEKRGPLSHIYEAFHAPSLNMRTKEQG
jgi:hypothetical protein